MPTVDQAMAVARVCQWLSNFYIDIHLFRYDPKYKELTVIAGETIVVVIPPNGDWRFEDD